MKGGNKLARCERCELIVADVVEVVLWIGRGLKHSTVVGAPCSNPACDDGNNGQCAKENHSRYGVDQRVQAYYYVGDGGGERERERERSEKDRINFTCMLVSEIHTNTHKDACTHNRVGTTLSAYPLLNLYKFMHIHCTCTYLESV